MFFYSDCQLTLILSLIAFGLEAEKLILPAMFTHFHDFCSNYSSDFGHAETASGAKKRVVLRREFFALI